LSQQLTLYLNIDLVDFLELGLAWVSLELLGLLNIVICGNTMRNCFWHLACVVMRMFLVGIFDVFLGVCGKYYKLIYYFVFTKKKKNSDFDGK
jgi:hypothetical protein